MSLLIDSNIFYGYNRTLHALRMLKRMYDAGFDVKKYASHFSLHAANTYGWNDDGEPLMLLLDLVNGIFPYATIYPYGECEDEVREIYESLDIPEKIKEEFTETNLETSIVIHIDYEDFKGIDFHFSGYGTIPDYAKQNAFYNEEKSYPIFHFRDKDLTSLTIFIDMDYCYIEDADTILQFILWIKRQLEEKEK